MFIEPASRVRHPVPLRWALPICGVVVVLSGCGVHFEGNFQTAQAKAAAAQRELFVFYKSWITPESGDLQLQLNRGPVQSRLAERTCCILDDAFGPNREFVRQYGVQRHPALLRIQPNGAYVIREGPAQVDDIVAFLDAPMTGTGAPPAPAVVDRPAPVITPPPTVNDTPTIPDTTPPPRVSNQMWFESFSDAADVAVAEQRDLFVLYNARFGGETEGTLERMLGDPQVADLLSDVVLCRLGWQHPPNRMRMAQFGVTNVPGFVLIAPTGQYHATQGQISAADLARFLRQARGR